ncbi:MAG: YraN family protein [Deltaproteobacteria bacterium]|nr:YraN family protein [Deltaproteobacteria bacterium]
MSAGHLMTGRAGEDLAAAFLMEKGWRVLERNFRCRDGELDLIGEDRDALVFVEVKTRSTTVRGEPGEAVGRAKQVRMIRAASRYLTRERSWDRSCRFDLIAVVFRDGRADIGHWEDIIDVRNALGRGHPAWQPW